MWETLHNADWDSFRIVNLPEFLKTQNRLQREFCACLEVTRMFPEFGCVRNKLLFCTVQRNLKLFLFMQVCVWKEFLLLIFGIWFLKCCTLLPPNLRNPKRMCRETCRMTHRQKKNTKNQVKTPIQYNDLELYNVNNVSSNVKPSQFGAMLYIFEDNGAVIKMILKGRIPKETCIPDPQSCA